MAGSRTLLPRQSDPLSDRSSVSPAQHPTQRCPASSSCLKQLPSSRRQSGFRNGPCSNSPDGGFSEVRLVYIDGPHHSRPPAVHPGAPVALFHCDLSWPQEAATHWRFLMRWRFPLVLSLIAFVAVSCDQQLVSPEVDQVASEATFDFMNNPDGGSLIIDRWESHWRACWQDSDNGLFVCHVTTPGGGT